MQRNSGDQESRSHQSTGSDLLTEEDGDDGELEGPGPQVVVEQDGRVEPVHVVGEQIDHLTHCSLAQGGVGELQSFPVEERTTGHSELHAGVHHLEEVIMVGEGVEASHGHHSASVEVSFSQAHSTVGGEILDHPSCNITVYQSFIYQEVMLPINSGWKILIKNSSMKVNIPKLRKKGPKLLTMALARLGVYPGFLSAF